MKRLFQACAALVFAIAVSVMAETVISTTSKIDREYKTYYSTMPGELYIIMATNVSGSTWFYTNNETEAWFPAVVDVIQGAGSPVSTNELALISTIQTECFSEYQTVTNDFGIVATNYLHVLTNTTYDYVCNTIMPFTNSSTNAVSFTFDNKYVQKGDIMRWTFSTDTSRWIRITGRR